MSHDGNCASIKIRALVLCVAGHMSNHRLAIVGEHYSREAAMGDAPAHAGPHCDCSERRPQRTPDWHWQMQTRSENAALVQLLTQA